MRYFIILTTVVLNLLSAEVEIVASEVCQVEHISQGDIKKIFMLKTTSIEGESVKVLDNADKKTYTDFVETYLHKSLKKIKTYWIRMLFTGRKIPPPKVSLLEFNSTDATYNCYLSYVEVGEKPKNWKIVEIK